MKKQQKSVWVCSETTRVYDRLHSGMSQNTMFVIEIPKFTDTAARKNIFRHKRSPAMSSYRKLGHERVELVYKHELLKVISLVGRSFSVQCDVTRGSRCSVCIEIPIVMDSSISITPMTCHCEGDHVHSGELVGIFSK